ncbi:LptF/LptG family permease [Deinococcus peraridilitoris]|uniref:Putative permease n=1 Tax=Deinococcus peraridilitoris (strain DSM 19664 / LMG 22246 / CIP 109416 / KR-200) TaxID=937777 RepID=L0A0B1_DEIPD|nr:LptF/LptG family permease [Deinococcus peraridilitoris]AFZ67281.1 putative permease [Deinococcus peraridilitoris DSM 19664]
MRLQRYILRELWPPLVTGTLLFTAIVSFGYFFASSQWLANAPFLGVLRYIALQVPNTLVQVFPMAVVLMVVVAYGRLANERELSAAQSGGVSLGRAALPAVGAALAVSGLSLYLSEYVVPRANVEARSFYWDDLTGAGLQQLAGRTVEIGPGLELHFQGYVPATRELQNVRLQQWSDNGSGRTGIVFFADRGRYENNDITLIGYQGYSLDYTAIAALDRLPEDASEDAFRAGVADIFKVTYLPTTPDAKFEIETGLSRKQAIAGFADAIAADATSLSTLFGTVFSRTARPAERFAARAELNRKLALPLGNLVLVLAALPFALRYGRTTGVALGVALLIAVSYYLVYVLGLSLGNSGVLPPELGAWLANITFALGGLYLLRKASS